MSNLKDICFDCADPWTLGHWWADVLGYRVRPHSEDDLAQLRDEGIDHPEEDPSIAVDPVGEEGPGFWFVKVPESKAVKNRVHIDVYAEVDDLERRGAKVMQRLPKWTVMTDPEGNEFCAFDPSTRS